MMEDPTPCGGIFSCPNGTECRGKRLKPWLDVNVMLMFCPNHVYLFAPILIFRGVGGPSVGDHLLWQLRPSHAHCVPVHHPWGVDRYALLGQLLHSTISREVFNISFSSRSTTHRGILGSSSTLCPWSSSEPSSWWTSFLVFSAGEYPLFFLGIFLFFSMNIHAWSFSYQAHLLIFSESSPKRRRKPNPEATSSGCEQNSKWRKTYKATWTGSLRQRNLKLLKRQMLYRWKSDSFLLGAIDVG